MGFEINMVILNFKVSNFTRKVIHYRQNDEPTNLLHRIASLSVTFVDLFCK